MLTRALLLIGVSNPFSFDPASSSLKMFPEMKAIVT